ncbi:MAG: hypothetical protein L0Y36_06595, partial [Planctomycetales bacterium]|nr:hypothetical protein [Planctomycetales bacterium]
MQEKNKKQDIKQSDVPVPPQFEERRWKSPNTPSPLRGTPPWQGEYFSGDSPPIKSRISCASLLFSVFDGCDEKFHLAAGGQGGGLD